jgi:hypothetical protein
MARDWKARPAPKPTTITECARHYHSCAVALAQTLGPALAKMFVTYVAREAHRIGSSSRRHTADVAFSQRAPHPAAVSS